MSYCLINFPFRLTHFASANVVPSYDLKAFLYFIPGVRNTVKQFIKGELNLRAGIKPIIFYVNKMSKLPCRLEETERVMTASLCITEKKKKKELLSGISTDKGLVEEIFFSLCPII